MSDEVTEKLPEVKVDVKDPSYAKAAEGLASYISSLANAFDSEEAILRRAREYLAKHPELVDSAYWVCLERDFKRDKGIRLTLLKAKPGRDEWWSKLSLGALLGVQSAGFDLETEVFRSADGARLSLGFGLVSMIGDDFGKEWSPAFTASFRIPLEKK